MDESEQSLASSGSLPDREAMQQSRAGPTSLVPWNELGTSAAQARDVAATPQFVP